MIKFNEIRHGQTNSRADLSKKDSQSWIPEIWIQRIFDRMLAFYGQKMVAQWSCIDQESLIKIWSEELSDCTLDELKNGISACKTKIYPPTLPEFYAMCKAKKNSEPAQKLFLTDRVPCRTEKSEAIARDNLARIKQELFDRS